MITLNKQENILPFLLELPTFLNSLEDSEFRILEFKNFITNGIKKVEGLKEKPKTKSKFIITFESNCFQKIITDWISLGLMNPQTGVIANGHYNSITEIPPAWYCMSMYFIEPNENGERVNKSWKCINMFPKATGRSLGFKNTGEHLISEIVVPFSMIPTFNNGNDPQAQLLLDSTL